MPVDETAYARALFQSAAYQPQSRQKLVSELYGDPSLRAIAEAEIARISQGQQAYRLMDRDHISRITHQTLTQALAEVAALVAAEPPAIIEETPNE